MVKTFNKTVRRTIKKHLSLFASVVAIIILGIAFITGLSATGPNMADSVDNYFKQANVPDIIIKVPAGITEDQRQKLILNPHVAQIEELTSFDTTIADQITRLYYMPLENRNLNKIEVVSGRLPENDREVLAERETQSIKKIEVGTKIDYHGEVEVVGIAANPLYFAKENEPSSIEGQYIESILYFDSNFVSMPFTTDIYVKANVSGDGIFSSKYKKEIKNIVAELETLGDEQNPFIFLTFQENASYLLYESNVDKISVISLIFPLFFILVAALVVLTTMTRLVEKERSEIGCYKTLGYSDGRIIRKYLFYAVICSIIGNVVGLVSGFRILPEIVYNVYNAMFYLPPLSFGFYFWFGIAAAMAMTIAIVFVTLHVLVKSLKEKPAALLQQKAPKSGKKIFLEHITFIWKRLKFKYKSSFRNVFRYFKHLLMTVISIAGCTALVFAAFSLNDCINNKDTSTLSNPGMFDRIADTMIFVVLIVIISAAALSIIVIYNLTNINIEERKKEIATLKVLGYKSFEVSGYIFREIFIHSIFGIIIGLPLGFGLLSFILSFMSSGTFTIGINVNWYTWFLTIFITLGFIFIVDFMLFWKIKKIDMNSSLKAVD